MARRLIIFALAASMTVLVAGVSASGEEQDIPPSTTTTTTAADSENNRNEVVHLEATPGLPSQFDKVRGRVQLVAYYDDHQSPAYPEPGYQAWMRLSNMPCLAPFLDPGQWTYALWVETPSNGLVRLFNFHSNCFLQTAAQEAVGGSANAALSTMLHETVRFRVTVENVEGETVFPDGAVILSGGVDRGLVVECGNPPPATPVIDEVVLDAGETLEWTLDVVHEDFCRILYKSTAGVIVDGVEQEPSPEFFSITDTFYETGLHKIVVRSLADGNVISIALTD